MSRHKRKNSGIMSQLSIMVPFIPEYQTAHYGALDGESSASSSETRSESKKMVLQHQEILSHAKETLKVYKKDAGKNGFMVHPYVVYMGATDDGNRNHRLQDLEQNYEYLHLTIVAHGNPKHIGTISFHDEITPELMADFIDGYIYESLPIPNSYIPDPIAKSPTSPQSEDMDSIGGSSDQYELTLDEQYEIRRSLPIKFEFQTCNSAFVDFTQDHVESLRFCDKRDNILIPETIPEEVNQYFMNSSYIGRFYTEMKNRGYNNISVSGYRGYIGRRSDQSKGFTVTPEHNNFDKVDRADRTRYEISSDGKISFPINWNYNVKIGKEKIFYPPDIDYELMEIDSYDDVVVPDVELQHDHPFEDLNFLQLTSPKLSPRNAVTSPLRPRSADKEVIMIE